MTYCARSPGTVLGSRGFAAFGGDRMAELRRCRWCRLILDVHAPPHGEMVASNAAGKRERRVRPHCAESPVCDWCEGCYQRRMRLIAAGLDPNTGDPPAVTPDTMA